MCGINGIINHHNKENATVLITKMNQSLKHRGPDDDGTFCDENIAFGQTRLSIIDLSYGGHQPMISECGNVVMVFNGEIYNYKNLKAKLKYNFKTNTDSEVIIAAYLEHGIDFIEKLEGMFAIALHDKKANKTFLIRDRFGVKPLYYSILNHSIFFSSEQRTLLKLGIFNPKLNLSKLKEYIKFATVLDGESFIEQICCIKPGSYLEITIDNFVEIKYYELKANNKENNDSNYSQIVKKTRDLIIQSVSKRLESDVPLAAFLSGGIDSSIVVAAMTELEKNVNTFHVSFNESKFSESNYASIVSKKFKTNHQEVIINSNDFINLIPQAIKDMDFPSLDGVNTYIVSKATKDAGITVALSGIGADEWFGGYPIFSRFNTKLSKLAHLSPKVFRKLTANLITALKDDFKSEKLQDFLDSNLSKKDIVMLSRANNSEILTNKLLKEKVDFNYNYNVNNISDLSILEWKQYLLPVLLRDADQMSMANALEIREPFMDHHLVEFILSLNDEIKSQKPAKKLLIDSFSDVLPKEILNRNKMGFVLPYEIWCKENLKDFIVLGLNELSNLNQIDSKELELLLLNFLDKENKVRWTQIWSLAVLGHWITNNLK